MTSDSGTLPENVEEIPVASKVIEAAVLIIIISVSVIGNTSLWVVVLRTRLLRNVTNMFILGLSTADLLVATTNMPLTVYTIISGNWLLSDSACVAVGFINMLTLVTSVLSLCNISINRFFMVCKPAKFKNIYTTRNAILMITGTVTFAVLLSSPPLFGWSKYVYTHTHSFCFADWVNQMSYAFFMIGCCFGIPFTVMTFCNIYIIKCVRQSRRKVKSKSNYRSEISSGTHADESRYEHSDYESNNAKNMATDTKLSESRETDLSTSRDTNINENQAGNDVEVTTMENNNVHGSESPRFSGELIQIRRADDEPDKQEAMRIEGTTCSCSNTDVLSDDSSNESNSALIAENRKRNQLFTNRSPLRNRSEINSIDSVNTRTGTNSIIKEPSLLHPGWRSSMRKAQDSSITIDSGNVVSVSIVNKSTDSGTVVKTVEPVARLRSTRLRRREEIRLAISLIVVVLLFVICWLPYCISMLVSIFYKGYVPRQFHMFTLLIGYANSCCNPIVYGVMNQRFKVGFKKIFCFWKTHRLSLNSST